jgi:hypothetical protein
MATRLYFSSSEAAGVSPDYDLSGFGWMDTSQADRKKLTSAKETSAFATKSAYIPPDKYGGAWVLARQYVSDPLTEAVSFSGSLKCQIRAMKNADAGVFIGEVLVVYVVTGDGSALRGAGSLFESDYEVGVGETSLTNLDFAASGDPLTAIEAQVGDRIVIEVGFNIVCDRVGGTGDCREDTGTVEFGEDSGSDLPEDNVSTDQYCPWIEFSQEITFGTPLEIETTAILQFDDAGGVVEEEFDDYVEFSSEALLLYSADAMEAVDQEPVELESQAMLYHHPQGMEDGEAEEPIESSALLALTPVSGFTTVTPTRLTSEAVLRYYAPGGFEAAETIQIESAALFRLYSAATLGTAPDAYRFISEALLQYPTANPFEFELPEYLESYPVLNLVGASSFTPPTPYQFTGSGLLILSAPDGFTPPDVTRIESEAVVRYSTDPTFQTEAEVITITGAGVLEYEAVLGLTPEAEGYQFTSAALLRLAAPDGFTTPDVVSISSEPLCRYASAAEFPVPSEPIAFASEALLKLVAPVGFTSAEAYQFTSEALLKYSTLLGFEAEAGLEVTSQALLQLVSGSTLRAGTDALQLESAALLKMEAVPGLAEVVSETLQFTSDALITYQLADGFTDAAVTSIESEASLYLKPVASVEVGDDTKISLTSAALLRHQPVSGLTMTILTEPTAFSITSEAGLIYGGLTDTLLKMAAEIEALAITSGALLYYYGDSSLAPPTFDPFQFTSQAVLDYYGANSLLILELATETIQSEPVLVYDPVSGTVETEVFDTWVLTTQSFHPSIYANYDFNSYIEIDGMYYGAKDDGIYLLEGATDAGAKIRPGLRLQSNLLVAGLKRIRTVQAENCGNASLRMKTTTDDDYADALCEHGQYFYGERRVMGREFILDFQDFDELGHLQIAPQVVKHGHKR